MFSLALHNDAGTKAHVSIQLSPTMSSYPAQGFLAKTYMVVVDTVEISRGNRLGTVQDRAQWPKFRIMSPKAHKICNRRSVTGRPTVGISLLGAGVAPSPCKTQTIGPIQLYTLLGA